ncbi:hypothetical protein K435DRAFT_188511 [Dendrothele bispora CBS 962.96]|uniref:Uncharacterized protein n=1 Tax=Dendrothele bispora (strain CBS 962.96) TaxID=1314807 RepID=A0A4S8LWZ4_DENBC|nr:hypothetical protein K435DRAFT_188511 [Dendrothele bispora CBS 962.96]
MESSNLIKRVSRPCCLKYVVPLKPSTHNVLPLEMPRKPGKLSKPSYREDRVAWNLAWERENDALYGTDQRFVLKPGQPIPDIPENMYRVCVRWHGGR